MPDTAEMMRATYCQGDNSRCARYLVISKGVKPPDSLFPTDITQAKLLLERRGCVDEYPPRNEKGRLQ